MLLRLEYMHNLNIANVTLSTSGSPWESANP